MLPTGRELWPDSLHHAIPQPLACAPQPGDTNWDIWSTLVIYLRAAHPRGHIEHLLAWEKSHILGS